MFKDVMGFLRYCWKLEPKYIIFLVLEQIVSSVIILFNIIISKFIIDELFVSQNYNRAVGFIIVTVVVNAVGNCVTTYLRYYAEKARDIMYTKYNISMSEKILNVEYGMLEDPVFHDLRSKAMKCMTSEFGFAGIIVVIANLFGNIILILSLSFVISFLNVFSLIGFLFLISLNVYINSKIKKRNINLDFEMIPAQREADYFRDVTNSVEYSKEIRINALQQWVLDKYNKVLEKIKVVKMKKNRNIFVNSTANNIIDFLEKTILYITLIYKAVVAGLSQGDFVMYLGTISKLNSSVTDAFNSITDIGKCKMYFEPFNEFMNLNKSSGEKELIKEIDTDVENKPYIEFVNVSFRYPCQSQFAIKNINVKIMNDEKISIVGENGAGKTTFVKLIMRLYKPTEGKILLYGADINDYDFDEYMKLFSVIFQDYKLFELSIKENIVLNDETNKQQELLNTVSEVGLSEKIENLDKGLDTQIGKNFDETGINPSGGESQKIAIARALYKDSPIIILDEPTAALDPRAEYEMYKNFYDLTENKTAIYISHRLSSTKFCDRIFVFDKGEIVENGSHDELLAENKLYAELFNMQAQFYM